LGDVLPDHLNDGHGEIPQPPLPQLEREQRISGLCECFATHCLDSSELSILGSSICFILALYDYPAAIKLTWGRMADEIDSNTWDMLNCRGEGHGDVGLGMLLKMTRLDDLGLGQLCLPDVDFTAGEDMYPDDKELPFVVRRGNFLSAYCS
jgi:hypothetical protein